MAGASGTLNGSIVNLYSLGDKVIRLPGHSFTISFSFSFSFPLSFFLFLSLFFFSFSLCSFALCSFTFATVPCEQISICLALARNRELLVVGKHSVDFWLKPGWRQSTPHPYPHPSLGHEQPTANRHGTDMGPPAKRPCIRAAIGWVRWHAGVGCVAWPVLPHWLLPKESVRR